MVTTFPDALLTCKLSSIDFQKNLEQQFYKDITNTRNAKIVCIVIVLQLSLIIMFFIVESCQFPSVLVSKPVKWTITLQPYITKYISKHVSLIHSR